MSTTPERAKYERLGHRHRSERLPLVRTRRVEIPTADLKGTVKVTQHLTDYTGGAVWTKADDPRTFRRAHYDPTGDAATRERRVRVEDEVHLTRKQRRPLRKHQVLVWRAE